MVCDAGAAASCSVMLMAYSSSARAHKYAVQGLLQEVATQMLMRCPRKKVDGRGAMGGGQGRGCAVEFGLLASMVVEDSSRMGGCAHVWYACDLCSHTGRHQHAVISITACSVEVTRFTP